MFVSLWPDQKRVGLRLSSMKGGGFLPQGDA